MSISVWAAFSWTAGGSVSSKRGGNVLTFLCITLFLLMGVAWGTASRWEEFGMAGTMEAWGLLAGLGRAGVALGAILVVVSFPLNWSSRPLRMSSTWLASRREMVLEVTCWLWPISTSFLLSSLVRFLLARPGYFLYRAPRNSRR